MAIVLLNGILGFVQEFKAEKAIEALKRALKEGLIFARTTPLDKLRIATLLLS